MKKLLLAIAFALVSILALNAEEKTKVYSFDDITRIEAGFLYRVHIKEGRSGKVEVVYESEYERHIRVKYRENEKKLVLELNDIPNKFKKGNQPYVYVYIEMDHIDEITLTGASKASFDGNFTADNLQLSISGAAEISGLNVNGKSIGMDFSGASKAEISGDFTGEVEMEISGASNGKFNISSAALDAELSGAGNILYTGNIKECGIECSGASKIQLSGKGSKVSIEGSGACNIDARDFTAEDVGIELSGVSKAKVNAGKILKYNISRTSKMTYFGDPELINLNDDDNVVKGD